MSLCPLLFIFFNLLPAIFPAAAADLSSDAAALLAFRSSLGSPSSLSSWSPSSPLCSSWHGVGCSSASGRVTSLRLPAASLSGHLPPATLSNLTSLRILSLRLNSLSGPLHPSLLPPNLRFLFLHSNRLSGHLPHLLPPNLRRLDLSDNQFSGPLPISLDTLTHLKTLDLQSNSFSGPIPDLSNLTSLSHFNVSFNRNLSGPIPKSLQSMPASSFLGIASLCDGPFFPPCPNEGRVSRGLSGGAIAGIVIGSVVSLLVLILVLLFFLRRSKRSEAPATDVRAVVPPLPPVENVKKLVFFGKAEFDLEDLLRASAEVMGKGTYGTAYKAVLETGVVVAVKRLKEVGVSEGEFRERVERIGKVNHPNVVRLKAYYFSKDEKLLVYEYMPMGSLSALLHGENELLIACRFMQCVSFS